MFKKENRSISGGLLVILMALLICTGTATSWAAEQVVDTVTVLKAEKLSCGSCAAKITDALETKEGVGSVEVEVATGKVTVLHDSKKIDADKVAAVVTEIGYPSSIQQTAARGEANKEPGSIAEQKTNQSSGCACCNKAKK